MHVSIPYTMLEPIRDLLDAGVQSDRDGVDENWVKSLHQEIYEAKVDISCLVAKKVMRLKAINALKVGDIIPIDMPETSTLLADGVPSFRVKLGRSEENLYALRVVEPIQRKAPVLGIKL
jgi:flagellar motor switch protein FliM